MKKTITLLSLLIYSFASAQESKDKLNIGVKAQTGTIGLFGLEAEYPLAKENKYANSLLVSINANAMKLETAYGNTIGSGFEFGIGSRNYLNLKSLQKGLFIDTNINYGSIKFDDKIDYDNSSFKVDGKFKYISILNSSLGYKILIKSIVIEPSVSARYNIEIKGEGFIDNKDIDNFLFNAGLKIGYSF